MHFAYYILYFWTYFKETYIILVLQVKEDVVPQKGPTAHNSWNNISWYVFQLMYFAISESFFVTDFSGRWRSSGAKVRSSDNSS